MDRPLIYAVSTSLIIHTIIFTAAPLNTYKKIPPRKKQETIVRIAPQEIKKIFKRNDNNYAQLKIPPYQDKRLNSSALNKNPEKITTLTKPAPIKTRLKKIVLDSSTKDEQLKKNPAYMDYYRFIREKIRKNAFAAYDSFATGEIILSFVINNTGALEEISLLENSSKNSQLQQIAIKSVKNSAPFAAFPDELKNYPRLKFNIYIQFKSD